MDPTTTLTKTSTKSSRSLCSGPIIVQLDSDNEHEMQAGDPAPLPLRVSGRALRRKKHLSIYRASAPPQSPVAEVAIEIPRVRPQTMMSPASPIHETYPTKPQMHNRTYSQPINNNIRLGHPSRPYYSAIRKNRPNSPLGDPTTTTASPSPSRPTSLALPARVSLQPSPTSFGYIPHAFDDADDDDDPFMRPPLPGRHTPSRFSFGRTGHRSSASAALPSGFSVSGEMEMRMALAALASGSGEDDSDFHFQETRKTTTTDSSVGGRVKKFGKGLKDLIHKKHGSSYTSQ
ncbi:hypothetical protein C8R46DRAFT_226428 [Mycena filopes]|nr:hypothetical protein C8R46DRAFT_226428 [Mycena filopes]